MLSQQYQVPDWELQLQGLIARNSTIREASPTTPMPLFSQPYPHQHWDMPNTVSPTSASQLKPNLLEGSKQQSRTDRALSMVRKEVEKQGNAMDIVRGQFAAFSNEFSSNRLTASSKESELVQLANDLQNDVFDRMDSLYVRRDEIQNVIAKEKASDRLCRLERRQNIIEEQLYEQSSATTSAGPLCSTHDKNEIQSKIWSRRCLLRTRLTPLPATLHY